MFPNKIVFLILFFYSFPLFSQQPYYRHYTVNDGLASSTVYKIIQDKKGFIWIATENGAQRFDGKTFKTFSKENGLLDNSILDLFEDSKGRIWFLSLSGQIAYWDNGIIHNTANDSILKNVDSKSNLTYFAEDKKGNIYISTSSHGVYKISKTSCVNYYSSSISGISNLWIDSDSVLYIGSLKGVSRLNGNNLEFVYENKKPNKAEGKLNKTLYIGRYIFVDKDHFIAMSDSKVYSITFTDNSFKYQELDLGSKSSIYNLTESKKENMIWIMTHKGVILYDIRNRKKVTTYLSGQIVNSVLEDNSGLLWFGTMGGHIYVFNSNSFYSLTQSDGLSEDIINDIILDRQKRLWLGYNNGRIEYLTNNKIHKNISQFDDAKWARVNHFSLDTNSDIYVSTEGGLKKIKTGTQNDFVKSDISLNSAIKTTSTTNYEDEKWFGSAVSLMTRYNEMIYIINSTRINSMLETDERELFIGTSKGLIQIDSKLLMNKIKIIDKKYLNYNFNQSKGDTIKNAVTSLIKGKKEIRILENLPITFNYTSYNPELSTRINDIEDAPNKTIWVATHGSGLFSIKNDTIIQQFKTNDGLSGNICKVIKIENDSLIWVGTNKGLNKLTFSNNKLNVDIFTSANGLISDDVNAIELQNDTVWVATSGGLSFFNKNHITKNLIPPPVYISQISLNNTDTTFLPHYDLFFSQNSISISFIGLSYQLPEKVSYKYQMQGLSDDWISTSLNIVKYDYLPAGDYKFSVFAKSPDGVWSLYSAEVSFHISPPFYQTWWFYTLSLLFISGLISFVFWYRLRQIKKQDKFKLLATEGELKALRAQMNPHFIFNSLNSIQYFISKSNNENAQKYLSKFSKLLRKILENSRQPVVTLYEDLEVLKLYLEIESLRFDKLFDFQISVNEEVDAHSVFIPPMILQPFVENSIIHGITPKKEGGLISIIINWEDEFLSCEIDDDGIGRDESLKVHSTITGSHKSLGMSVTKERLDAMSSLIGDKAKIEITDKKDDEGNSTGTKVKILIPVENVI